MLTAEQQQEVLSQVGAAMSIAYRYLKNQHWGDAEDVHQAALLGLCQGVACGGEVLGRAKVAAFRQAQQRWPRGYRRREHWKAREFFPVTWQIPNPDTAFVQPDQPDSQFVLDDLFAWWLKQLDPLQTALMRGLYWEGRAMHRVTEWLGISRYYARQLRSQALDLLRSQVV